MKSKRICSHCKHPIPKFERAAWANSKPICQDCWSRQVSNFSRFSKKKNLRFVEVFKR